MDDDIVLPKVERFFGPSHAPPDLHAEYKRMVAKVEENLSAVTDAYTLLNKILKPYVQDHGELIFVIPGPQAHFELEGRPYSNFGAIPLYVIPSHLLDHTEYRVRLLVWGKDLPTKVLELDAKALGGTAWLGEELGPQFICERPADLKVLIQALTVYAPIQNEYHYQGWEITGQGFYIWKGQLFNGDVWEPNRARAPCAHTLGMLDVAPHSLTIPLAAIAVLSLVHSRMRECGTFFRGICCLLAPTQSYKTTLAALFFDFEAGREASVNFEGTVTAMANSRDKVTIIDDLKPGGTKAENKEMLKKLSTVIRMCSDDAGGVQKAGRGNTTISNEAQGLVIVTAEQVQLEVQSSLARLLILELNRKDVDLDKLTYYQEQHQQYQAFIKDFIRWIARAGVDKFCEQLADAFVRERYALRNALQNPSVQIDNRTSDMTTWLWLAFGEFLRYAATVGALTPEQVEGYAEESLAVFTDLMAKQAERVSNLDPVGVFLRGLSAMLDTQEAKLGELQARNTCYSAEDQEEVIGFKKKGFVYLKNGTALQRVISHYKKLGRDFTLSETALRKALADIGAIVLNKNGKTYVHRVNVNHKNYQAIAFDSRKFDELMKGGESHGREGDPEFSSDRALRRNAADLVGR